MVNRSGDSGHLCLLPDLRGVVFSFWSWKYLWICHIQPLLHWNMFLLYALCNFVKRFLCINWDHMVFMFSFVNVMYHINWFTDVEPPLNPRGKYYLYNHFNIFFESSVLIFCWEFLNLCSSRILACNFFL